MRSDALDVGYNQSYTSDMKTAVSIPDHLFRQAEDAAKRLSMSRSQLYATALAEFLRAYAEKDIAAALDRVYESEPSELDLLLESMQSLTLPKEDW